VDHNSPTEGARDLMKTSSDAERRVLSDKQKAGTLAFEILSGVTTSW